jgi:two-component sensor histidine kinase
MNDTAFKFLSGSREKYIGKSFLSLFPYALTDGMFDAFKGTAETGIPSEGIYYYDYGEYKGWYRDSVIKFDEGIIVYFRDITHQKKLELELENKSRELANLLQEKNLLLKETHHRIKNNLQLLASLVNLQSANIKDPYYREMLNIDRHRILNIAKIHEGFYENNNFSSVNFKKYIMDLTSSLISSYIQFNTKIDVKYIIEEVEIGLNHSINIGLIINELFINSIKYAFQNREIGNILISLKRKNDILEIIISDDGKGMNTDLFYSENSDTSGILIVKSLVNQMDGTIELKSIQGTSYLINIPIHQ